MCFEKICRDISPVGHRSIREENTKVKAWVFPPAVFTKQDSTKVDLLEGLGNDFNSGNQPVGLSSDSGAVQATSGGGNVRDATFFYDFIVEVTIAEVRA